MKFVLTWGLALSLAFLSVDGFTRAELAPEKPYPNAGVRRGLAKEWAAAFAQVDRQLPDLSPSQEAWLRNEYHQQIDSAGGRYTPRALAATSSPEYQIYIAKPRTGEILTALTRIASGAARDKNHEVALWASIANGFIDYGYWQAITSLIDRKTIERRIGHVDSHYYENYALQAQGILSKIVIPHLEGRLP